MPGGPRSAAPDSGSTDPLSQLIALVQSGVPIATIANHIASQITNQGGLQAIVANAISPPGNAPPGTATQEVLTLVNRLQQWLMNGIAGAGSQGSGQQSEFSGQLLDAISAKVNPAHSIQTNVPALADAFRLVQSLLGAAAAALSPAAVPSTSQVPSNQPGTIAGAIPFDAPPSAAPGTIAGAITFGGTANPSSGYADPSAADAAASSGMPNAPDLLARMVARAASVDAQIGGTSTPAPLSTPGTPSLASSAARFAATMLTTAVTAPAAGSSGNNSPSFAGSGGGNGNSQQQSQSLFASALDSSMGGALASGVAPIAQQLPDSAVQTAQAPIDVDAIVEQMVKGISLRSVQPGTSEIRLQLAPENLGAVSLKLTVQGASISASVVAQNGHVRDALLNNQQQLATALADSGLTLSGFSVDVSGGDAGQQQQGRAGGFGRRYVLHELAANGTEDDTTTNDPRPPLTPASSLGLLNSLA